MYTIPETFLRVMQEVYPEGGPAWCAQLPALLGEIEQRWSLTIHPPFQNLSYNYVVPAQLSDGSAVVLKFSYPDIHFQREAEALRLYGGRGICKLLRVDIEHGVQMLERLQPGRMLRTVADEDEAMRIAAEVLCQLWRPVPDEPHLFPEVKQWAAAFARMRARFDGGCGPFPRELFELGERLYTELPQTQVTLVLLHGDLHHDNILSATRQPWLAIDPKGMIGEPAYEIGALLRNPFPELLQQSDPSRVLTRRIDLLCEELELDRQRVRSWGCAQAVLSALWSYEDHGTIDEARLTIARLLAP